MNEKSWLPTRRGQYGGPSFEFQAIYNTRPAFANALIDLGLKMMTSAPLSRGNRNGISLQVFKDPFAENL
jgi:hypothetical protein